MTRPAGVPAEYRGRYKAFTLTGTTLNGDGLHPTCLDYLKRLGVTHVQLMPVYDYGSVPEPDPAAYNWGYDPVNYNVPEGSYATDPDDGAVRIRELKEAVQALHKNGFRVIMDVVYNHTYRLDSWLWRTEPWYFYRQNPERHPPATAPPAATTWPPSAACAPATSGNRFCTGRGNTTLTASALT